MATVVTTTGCCCAAPNLACCGFDSGNLPPSVQLSFAGFTSDALINAAFNGYTTGVLPTLDPSGSWSEDTTFSYPGGGGYPAGTYTRRASAACGGSGPTLGFTFSAQVLSGGFLVVTKVSNWTRVTEGCEPLAFSATDFGFFSTKSDPGATATGVEA